MNTELEVLKAISVKGGRASIPAIARDLKMGNDYIGYLCEQLLKRGWVRKLRRGRDWYQATRKGVAAAGGEMTPSLIKRKKRIKKITIRAARRTARKKCKRIKKAEKKAFQKRKPPSRFPAKKKRAARKRKPLPRKEKTVQKIRKKETILNEPKETPHGISDVSKLEERPLVTKAEPKGIGEALKSLFKLRKGNT